MSATVDYLPPGSVNHWEDYGGPRFGIACKGEEFCYRCGEALVEHVELTGQRSRRTGGPTYERLHSCPTWIRGWRARWWARGWACPGMGHASHDADNPLSGRGYR